MPHPTVPCAPSFDSTMTLPLSFGRSSGTVLSCVPLRLPWLAGIRRKDGSSTRNRSRSEDRDSTRIRCTSAISVLPLALVLTFGLPSVLHASGLEEGVTVSPTIGATEDDFALPDIDEPGDPIPSLPRAERQDDLPLVATRMPAGMRVRIDGRLDDEAWSLAQPITDFTQRDPVEGAEPTRRTEIRVLFDEDALYIGAFFDDDPEGVIAHQRRRNAGLGSDDRFMWILDTFGDGRTGYFFEVNPAGLMGDGIITPGSGSSINKSWDGIWEVRTGIQPDGWVAEIRIPFSTLNFDPNLDAWGINFQRTIRRRNEEILWRGWRRNQSLFRPVHAGRLEGLEGISQGLGIQARPFISASGDEATAAGTGWGRDAKAGMDVSYNITPSLRAAVTVNTDFAEVEVDQRRVNLTRFPLVFPEQRDFFLEGSGVFNFAPSSGPRPFFSRRIGLVDGEEVPIRAGARLIGQVGRSEIGFYQMRTGAATLRAELGPEGAFQVPGEDFTVARLKQAVFQQSHLGAVYTRRAHATGPGADVPDRHTVGLDADFITSSLFGRYNAQIEGFLVVHTDPLAGGWNQMGDHRTRGWRLNFPNDLVRFHVSHRSFGESYAPAVGFVPRRGFARTQPTLTIAPLLGSVDAIRRLQFSFFYEYLTDLEGRLMTRSANFTLLETQFESGDQASLQVNRGFERLLNPFTIRRDEAGPVVLDPGSYSTTEWQLSGRTAGRRIVSGNASFTWGDFWSGDRRRLSGSVTARPLPGFSFSTDLERNEVRLPEGQFDTNLMRFNGAWDASPFTSFSSSIQYDDVSRIVGLFARARWIVRPGNDIYLVWTHNWLNTDGALGPEGEFSERRRSFETLSRGGAFKINYTLRL